MAISVLATAKTASGVDRRARRVGPRPRSPKLGNFARLFKTVGDIRADDSDSDKADSPLRLSLHQSPASSHATLVGPTSTTSTTPLLGTGLISITDSLASPNSNKGPAQQGSRQPRLAIPALDGSTTDDDSPARDTPMSADIASFSRDTTPTSASPATPAEADLSPKLNIRSLLIGSTPEIYSSDDCADPFCDQIHTVNPQEKHAEFHHLVFPAAAPLKILNPNDNHLGKLQHNERIALAQLAAKQLFSPVAEPLVLPWDINGDFLPGHYQHTVTSPWVPRKPGYHYVKTVSKNSIDPLYRVDKETQLNILKAKLDQRFVEDSLMRSHPQTAQSQEPIHVFVDLSNIVIGYYDCMKAKRGVSNNYRVQAPPFFFEAFALILERYRPCAKRAVVGSLKPASQHPDYMVEAEVCGYDMNILQRVTGPKQPKSSPNQNPNVTPKMPMFASGALDEESDDYGPWCPPIQVAMKHREQGVDEILHLKMVQSILDAPRPGTMVLATGDAAEAEFSDGFLSNVERALERGWNVELVGWRRNISGAWRNQAFLARWAVGQFRLIELDDFAEELLGFWLRPGQRGSL
ncbi:hypothetical protein KVR01_012001 [Diaporthe batatas]|uniref:uncharacterized protein n=1 Tax=Diaporthe batatas TaxID=748121 RepID=UPI001D049E26|nr:uncharacterized protein KVR01_012001 [Diaporthe batatas]KAG8158240.1 hypothetical protein KVR01_012001 [Diaporthe batatas]